MDLENAIAAHKTWTIKLRNAILSNETLDVDVISRDNCCELGKWLHGEGKDKHCGLAGFFACVEKHAAFHIEAGNVANLVNEKRNKEAEDQLDYASSAFGQASNSVILALTRLKQEVAINCTQ